MDRGVIYLLTGPSHGVRLVVSLWSLRQYFSGPIVVYSTNAESHAIVKQCQRDSRLNVDHRPTTLVDVPRNATFLTKLEILPDVPFQTSIYLDADTLIVGSISRLFEGAQNCGFAATRFSQWVTTGRTMRKRIEAWRSIKQSRVDTSWLSQLIDNALLPRPAVNSGVFAFQRDTMVLAPWRELAYAGWDTFICEELALQLILPSHRHEVLECQFNCSPVHAHDTADVRIWHFHGEKHLSNQAARDLWWPAYQACCRDNIAGIADWTPGADKRLSGALKKDELQIEG